MTIILRVHPVYFKPLHLVIEAGHSLSFVRLVLIARGPEVCMDGAQH